MVSMATALRVCFSGASARRRAWTLGIALSLGLLAGPALAARPLTALAPVEVVADGFRDLRGLVVDARGNVVVADRDTGTLTRLGPNGARAVVATGLERPIGLAVDPTGLLLVAEEKAGRVVRVEATGRRTPVLVGVKQPRWLAVRDDGTVFVSARRLTRDRDAEPDDESAEPEVILAFSPAGQLTVFADSFKHLQGLAVNHATLFAATQGRLGDRHAAGVVYRIPILSDGSAGPALALGPTDAFKKPVGLARDRLGSLYLTTQELGLGEDPERRGIAKLHAEAHLTLFAASLKAPHGLALDASGHLYVADGKRVLRFLAPPVPAVSAPGFTNRSPLSVTGRTDPKAVVDLFVNQAAAPVSVIADATGAFTAQLALAPNARNALEVFATAHGGDGLTSPPAEPTIVHDSIAPSLNFQAPPAGAHVRRTVSIQAQASDGGSGVATLALTLDGQTLPSTVVPVLPAPSATASVMWLTTAVADGSHTLGVAATDRAGNSAFTARVVIVDNTPPTVQIIGGPTGTVQGTSAPFTFTGADNLTPVGSLQFAWRLDGGAWSAFALDTTATLTGLAPGNHLFEVKARDLAGNESLAAQRSFTVSALRVTITDPGDGSRMSPGLVLVRGIVDAGGVEVGVTVNGFPGVVLDGAFAGLVPVTSATGSLVAVATTIDGASASQSIGITVSGTAQATELLATPAIGVAPLTVTLTLSGGAVGEVSLDVDGEGVVDFSGAMGGGRTFTYVRPGMYFPTASLTDAQGNSIVVRSIILVYDRAAIDAVLKAKWNGMKSALIRNDVEAALAYFTEEQRARYRTLLTVLSAQIAQIARDMQDIDIVYLVENQAKYRLRRIELYGGQLLTFSYYVYFVQDGSGFWSVEGF